jgi:hypothetical protein
MKDFDRDLSYVGNMAVDLYENVIAQFPDVHSNYIEWLDHSGEKLIMSISKVFD